MKAILNQDIIIHITQKGDTEIGNIPADKKGVGLERLRWDGEKIIDLADFTEIWVEALTPDFFVCHAIEVPRSQKVIMAYHNRKNLIMDQGKIRLSTTLEIAAQNEAEKKIMIKNRLRQSFKRGVGDPEDSLADAWKIIALLIIYMRTRPPRLSPAVRDDGGQAAAERPVEDDQAIATFLDAILPDLQAAYPFEKVKDALIDNAKTIKTLMEGYRSELQSKD